MDILHGYLLVFWSSIGRGAPVTLSELGFLTSGLSVLSTPAASALTSPADRHHSGDRPAVHGVIL